MALFIHTEHDFGASYKLFKELEVGEKVYLIDIGEISVKDATLKSVEVEDVSDYYSHNRYQVRFSIDDPEVKGTNNSSFTVYDGNTFITEHLLNGETIIICTDERIAKSITNLLYIRNEIQWKKFTSIFGNPIGEYALKDVVLG